MHRSSQNNIKFLLYRKFSSLPIQVRIVWSFLERTDGFFYRAADFLTF